MREAFSCSRAISRNIGCVAVEEQDGLRRKRVAIAGMGSMCGSGGGGGDVYLLTVARLGSGAFNIQMGASVSIIGTLKVDAPGAMAKDINPEVDVENFSLGCVSQQARVHRGPGAIFPRCNGLP